MKEIWKPVVGLERKYAVSNLGNVKSLTRLVRHPKGGMRLIKGRILKQSSNRQNYKIVGLSVDCKCKTFLVNRLVLIAFNPVDGYEDLVTRHNDDNPENNNISNLCWGTPQDNANDMKLRERSCLGSVHYKSKLKESDIPVIRKMFDENFSRTAIAETFGVSRRLINAILSGQRWAHA